MQNSGAACANDQTWNLKYGIPAIHIEITADRETIRSDRIRQIIPGLRKRMQEENAGRSTGTNNGTIAQNNCADLVKGVSILNAHYALNLN